MEDVSPTRFVSYPLRQARVAHYRRGGACPVPRARDRRIAVRATTRGAPATFSHSTGFTRERLAINGSSKWLK